MDKETQKKLILDLIFSSKIESGFEYIRPSYKEAATIYVELDDDIEDLKYQYLSEFDGFGKDKIEKVEKAQKQTIKIIEKYLKALKDYIPTIKNGSRKEITFSEISSEKLKKFCISFNRSTAREHSDIVQYISCKSNVTTPLKGPLKKVGKACIKLNLIETVLEDIELEGIFRLKEEFETVPDACRFYEKELGENVTRKDLKSQIKKFAAFSESGEKLEWDVVIKRINSWVDHENSKPNRQKIPHE